MSKKKQLTSLYEYSTHRFEIPLTDELALLLSRKCEELKKHFKSTILEPVHDVKSRVVGVRSFQFVGVLQIAPSFSIQILPKMSNSTDDESAWQSSIQNLLYMMQYSGKLMTSQKSSSKLDSFKGDFYEILIYLFATTLLAEVRGNLYHEYESREQNLQFLRGKLMFSKHILQNGVTQDKFFVSTDNFEFNNKLNIVLAYVVRMLLKETTHTRSRQILTELSQLMGDVERTKVTTDDANRININRMNERFVPALNLAKLFLNNKSIKLSSSDFNTTTFLINMNELFEDYITAVCRKVVPQDYALKAQGPREYLVSAHYKNDPDQSQALFMMKPDISLVSTDGEKVQHIIDTKYKILEENNNRLGVSQVDMYQMYAYANKYKTKNITLLYPKRPDQDLIEATNVIDDNCTVTVKTIDLNRDLRKCDRLIRVEVAAILNTNINQAEPQLVAAR